MPVKTNILAATAFLMLAGTAMADQAIKVMDPYARSSMMSAKTGAAFMMLKNTSDEDDRLISASSDIAERVELHTHIQDANGVMQMTEIEGGIAIPAGGSHMMQRGGDHVMFLGLKEGLKQDDMISVTLTFEKAGDVVVEVPVDLTRKPKHGGMMHGKPKTDS